MDNTGTNIEMDFMDLDDLDIPMQFIEQTEQIEQTSNSRKRKYHEVKSEGYSEHCAKEEEEEEVVVEVEEEEEEESDYDDEKSYHTWTMIINMLNNLCEHWESSLEGITSLLDFLISGCSESASTFVPPYEDDGSDEYKTLEGYYYNFDSWLLGELLFLCSCVERAGNIWNKSCNLQTTVLKLLQPHNYNLFTRVSQAYYLCMNELLNAVEQEHNFEKSALKLNNFILNGNEWKGGDVKQHFVTVRKLSDCYLLLDNLFKVLMPAILSLNSEPHLKIYAETWDVISRLLKIPLPDTAMRNILEMTAQLFEKSDMSLFSSSVLCSITSSLRVIVESHKEGRESVGVLVADILNYLVKIENSDIVYKKLLLDMCTQFLKCDNSCAYPEKLLESSSLVVVTLLEKNEELNIDSALVGHLIENMQLSNSGVHIVMHQIEREVIEFHKAFDEKLITLQSKIPKICYTIKEKLDKLDVSICIENIDLKVKLDGIRISIAKTIDGIINKGSQSVLENSMNQISVSEVSLEMFAGMISDFLEVSTKLSSLLEVIQTPVIQTPPFLLDSLLNINYQMTVIVNMSNELSTPLKNMSIRGTDASNTWEQVRNKFSVSLNSALVALSEGNNDLALKILSFLFSTTQYISVMCLKVNGLKTSTQVCSRWRGVEFLGDTVNLITEFVVDALNVIPTNITDQKKIDMVFVLLQIVSHLLKVPDFGKANQNVVNTSMLLLSLPWIASHEDYLDLEQLFLPAVKMQEWLKNIDFHSCTKLKIFCIEHLLYFPKDIAVIWRTNIFQKCLKEDNLDVRVAAVKLLPALLLVRSSNVEKLVSDAIKTVTTCQDNQIKLSLSEVLGVVVCSLCNTCKIARKLDSNCMEVKYCVFCCFCDAKEENKVSISLHVINAVKIFLTQSLRSPVSANRCNVLCCLPHITKHTMVQELISVDEWLPLLQDNDYDVRLEFSTRFKLLLLCELEMSSLSALCSVSNFLQNIQKSNNNKTDIFTSSYKYLLDSILISMMEKCGDKQKTLEKTVFHIGCVDGDAALLCSVSLLVIFILHQGSVEKDSAIKDIKALAVMHNTTPKLIFVKYKDELSDITSNLIISHVNTPDIFMTMLRELGCAFEMSLTQKFVDSVINIILPHVIMIVPERPDVKEIITQMASGFNSAPVKSLLEQYFQRVYSYLVLQGSEDNLKMYSTYLEEAGISLTELKKRSHKMLCSELLLNFSTNPSRVENELKNIIALDDPVFKDSSQLMTRELLTDRLSPLLMGTLVSMNDKIVFDSVSDCKKIRVLTSLKKVIKLMGPKHITSLRYKIVSCLRCALLSDSSEFQKMTCKVWNTFVHNVELDVLGSLLATIFVSLLRILEKFPEDVGDIFRFLVQQDCLRTNFRNLYFVPNHTAIQDVYNTIHMEINEERELFEILRDVLPDFTHENVDIQIEALKYLKKLVAENYTALHTTVMKSNEQNSLITEIMETLISMSRSNNRLLSHLCAECIGEIGAIDAGMLPHKEQSAGHTKMICPCIRSDSFKEIALLEIVRSFQNCRDTENSTVLSYIIQEFLKIFKISPSVKSSRRQLWEKLPKNIQDVVKPFVDSQYSIVTTVKTPTYPHPLYRSTYGQSFCQWMLHLVIKFIPLIKDEFVVSFLEVLLPGLRLDKHMLVFFFPYIILHVLLTGEESTRVMILEEILAPFASLLSEESIEKCELSFSDEINNVDFETNDEERVDDLKCVSIVCTLVEFLDKWLREWKSNAGNSQNYISQDSFNNIKEFCDRIPKLDIAAANYHCKEYSRALLYAEYYLKNKPEEFQDQLPLLTKIYTKLEEVDAVAGILTIQQQEPNLEDLILANELTGNLQEAVSCYERLSTERSMKPQFMKGMVNCYLRLDNPFTAVNVAQGMVSQCSGIKDTLFEEEAEAFWRLRRFGDLSDLLCSHPAEQRSWGSDVGRLLLNLRDMQHNSFVENLESARDFLLKSFATTNLETGTYRSNYQTIVRLQILSELEALEQLLRNVLTKESENSIESINKLLKKWDIKLKCSQKSSVSREPILCLRRITLELANTLLENRLPSVSSHLLPWIGKFWISSARLARNASLHNQAYNFIMQADKYKLKNTFIEKAKIQWEKGQQELSLITLKRGIKENFPNVNMFKERKHVTPTEDQIYCAKAFLLVAKYNDKMDNVSAEVNIRNYRETVDIYNEREKSFICLARYYDRIISGLSDEEKDLKNSEYQLSAMYCYLKTLLYGSNHIYQAMSRLLSIWLDYGTRYSDLIKKTRPSSKPQDHTVMQASLNRMNNVIDSYLKKLPAYMFLTAFPQIASRICHPVTDVFVRIKCIIAKLIATFPHHTMWMFIPFCKSSFHHLAKKSQEILQDSQVKDAKLTGFIQDFRRLADQLIDFINTPIEDGVSSATVSSIVRTLPLLFRGGFSEIMMPTERLRSIVLPTAEENTKNHNAFPRNMVYITGISEEVTVLQSLQKPRKVSFRGSDGLMYPVMGKPKDDLRRDFRIMQFHAIINSYLQKDPDSLQRSLQIRTYSVVPLNEECGIVEWIPNLVGLRPIVINLYKQKGCHVTSRELKKMICDLKDPLEKKRDVFLKQLIPKHPPIFAEWFYQTFPEPYRWYCARTSYIRTLAVMSIVGYIVGLGDRHGENILMDSTCGDAIHVDFNCLFNRGEAFDWPERVPFRLTHNMVDAMGPMGIEGIFRRTCEVTLQVIRSQQDTLLSVLRPFVYDPMSSFGSRGSRTEMTNEQAIKNIQNIEHRIEGKVLSKKNNFVTHLSVKGQTNALIQEATNIDNLCQMYIGWGAYY